MGKVMKRIAVLGAGNGGIAAAADLTHRGFEVRLHARSEARLEPIRTSGGIRISGELEGHVTPHLLTTDLPEAVSGADCIMIVTPSTAHEAYAHALSPLLQEDQIVLVNPGHSFGGLHVAKALKNSGFSGTPLVCETVTLSYVCRLESAAHISIFKQTENLGFGAFPGEMTDELLSSLIQIYPNLIRSRDVLEMGLSNINAIFHPPGMIMNAGWIEHTGGNFLFYAEGMTEAPGRVAEAIDTERLAIAEALGYRIPSFLDHFRSVGLTTEAAASSGSISRACKESAPNARIRSPGTLRDRYLLEDVGFGLVPYAHLGRLAGVPTPAIDAVIALSSISLGSDFMNEGRTLASIGIEGVPPGQLQQFIETGVRP